MADFLAEDDLLLSQAAIKIEKELSDDLLLSQMADAMEYEYIIDQAVSDYIPKTDATNFGLNFDLSYLSS
ncbi:MAG: hypothetical protein AB2693_27730 [Candidatus Thiodiazotropha sp.]